MFGEARPAKGVNLGGWLVLEKWITPSLFADTHAIDEYSFCRQLGRQAEAKLKVHRDSFIGADDFKWLIERGIDIVRLPVGHWAFGNEPPYVGCIDYVDFAFSQAEQRGLKIVLDLHGAPGSQNGHDHSGRIGHVNWHMDEANIKQSLKIITKLADRYAKTPSLAGIELLNEPGWHVPHETLLDYYKRGYEIVRTKTRDDVAVIISDAYKPEQWFDVMPQSDYKNLVIDMHLYQVFTAEDRALSLEGHISKALNQWRPLIDRMRRSNPIIIGEWSAEMQYKPEKYIDEDEAARQYATAQLQAFEPADAWFFWTYKTETSKYWSLRECVPDAVSL